MFASVPHATVNEIWHLALPSGTSLAAGEAGLQERVEWVTSLRAAFPLFGELGQGYLALASMSLIRRLGPRITLPYLLRELAKVKAAAFVVDAPLDEADLVLADQLVLPVLVVPPDSELHAIEREVLRTLVDREGQLARREMDVRQALQRLYAGGGLQAVLGELARLAEGEATLIDNNGVRVGTAAHAELSESVPVHSYAVTVAGKTLGRLLLRTAPFYESPLSDIYGRQAAEICGIEMLQQLTRRETEERLGAELVEQLLDEAHDFETIASRLSHLGYDLSPRRHHLVIAYMADSQSVDHTLCEDASRDLRWIAERDGANVLVVNYRDSVICFCSFLGEVSDRRGRLWVRESLANVGERGCHAGVSRLQETAQGLRAGTSQALDAANLGRRIASLQSPYLYEELGLYRLLVGLSSRDELQRFYEETLGLLAGYDDDHNSELVKTLEVFFEHNANASQTARALYVHRNTLNYRLQRIVEITGLDLNDAEARLAFQLALKIRHISS